MGIIGVSILGIVTVGVGRAFFGLGRMKTKTAARLSTVDYENALIQNLGEQVFSSVKTCTTSTLRNLNFAIGDLGIARFLADDIRNRLSANLGVSIPSTSSSQIELNDAFNSCPLEPAVPNISSPGSYVFCVGLEGPEGKGFQGMLGVFAQVRIDLGFSFQNSAERLLAGAVSCDKFQSTNRPESRELKINYKIFFKRFQGADGVFTKSGSRIYSQ